MKGWKNHLTQETINSSCPPVIPSWSSRPRVLEQFWIQHIEATKSDKTDFFITVIMNMNCNPCELLQMIRWWSFFFSCSGGEWSSSVKFWRFWSSSHERQGWEWAFCAEKVISWEDHLYFLLLFSLLLSFSYSSASRQFNQSFRVSFPQLIKENGSQGGRIV